MYCPKCGKPTEEADSFCRDCGHNLKPTVASGNPQPSQVYITNPRVGKDAKILGVALIAVGLVMIFSVPESWFSTLGLVVALAGVIIGAIGEARHWYHAK